MRAILALAVICNSALAQSQTGASLAAPTAMRLAVASRIVLDGRATEASWAAAASISDLRQHDPAVGEPATERTEVRVLFDSSLVRF